MPILHPKHDSDRFRSGLPEYRTLACPRYGHRVTWCRQICTPIGTMGDCGRLAPHAMIGKTQAAIAAYNEAHFSD